MLLNSLFFIFAFLPPVLLLYYAVGPRYRNLLLFAAGLVFYAWGNPVYVILLLFSVIFHYGMGIHLENAEGKKESRADMVFAVFIDVFLLFFFKYYGMGTEILGKVLPFQIGNSELVLPVGLSFYTFKNISYLSDVYTKKVKAERNFLAFGAYATLFPVMTAGPIVRYADISRQLRHRRINIKYLGYGAQRFVMGLGKKILLADSMALLYAGVSGGHGRTVLGAWLGVFAYTMEIYFDFSGYSDMAIGIGRMLGFQFKENFEYPYASKSITEFWRRWHISLGSWFRDYVYIPLGGNRVNVPKHIRNILVVWCLTGMWHGASMNFIVWGLYYGVLLLFEKYVLRERQNKLPDWIRHIYTMLLVMIGWIFFSNSSMKDVLMWLKALVGIGTEGLADEVFFYYLKSNLFLMIICILASGTCFSKKIRKLINRSTAICVTAYALIFILSVAYLVFSSYHPFLYLQF